MELPITSPAQVRSAADAARELARRSGLAARECEEVALAVMELGSNLVKHAGGGKLRLSALAGAGRQGIEIVSEDRGPGIPDIERAFGDGFSTTGTLGAGLGAVNRLVDEIECFPRQDGGLRIVCQRWARPPAGQPASAHLEFGVATRARRFMPANGDAVVVRRWDEHALAGVIDGLGHGELAQRAAQAARHYLETHYDQPLLNLFRGVGRVCRSTRGVVMAAARFDLRRSAIELASVGNIDAWLLGRAEFFQPVVRRGIVGMPNAPEPVITKHHWSPAHMLILHSDGIQGGWQAAELARLSQPSAAAVARDLLVRYGRIEDDATVLVARTAHSGARQPSKPLPPG